MNGNLSETLAAGRIIDVMTGGKFDWRARLEDCDFLESGDWLTALAYARAALSPPDAGEVRTYREGVREQGQREGFAAAVQWLRDRSAMKPNPPLADAAMTLADQMEQSRIPAAAIRKLP